ncbi:hypothetical protein QUW35_10410 [Ligilactobacillus agilis]|nr:hypothetical protein [Ligilactobacillus agilis]MDM8281072.1 hypothetical protein [Ligilactobacillus agilis]
MSKKILPLFGGIIVLGLIAGLLLNFCPGLEAWLHQITDWH